MIVRNSLAILRQISEIEEKIEKELRKHEKEKRSKKGKKVINESKIKDVA